MGLKQSIVVRSEFSVSDGKGGGSRGKTPGKYVMEYMSRYDKVEDLAPVRRLDDADLRDVYIEREALLRDPASLREIAEALTHSTGFGGVAMGGDGSGEWSVSYSHARAVEESKRLQADFMAGHTVMKTVISFDGDYLREMGVVDADFECHRRGDYRGNVDQLKLRHAIASGMDNLSRTFDSLRWVGVIHVDTEHVHCHLAMTDEGVGRKAIDGTQRGKLSQGQIRAIRTGIDTTLHELLPMRTMTRDREKKRENVRTFVKRRAYEAMIERGFAQLLVANLPADSSYWRFGSGLPEMERADELAREFVEGVLARDGSGMDEAMGRVAEDAMRRSGGDVVTAGDMVASGRERIIASCADAVYDVLADIPEVSRRSVRSTMLDVSAASSSELAASRDDDPAFEFGLRLRTYSSRADRHAEERRKWHERVREFEAAPSVTPEAMALLHMYRMEEEYHAMLVSKYGWMLSFLSSHDDFADDVAECERLYEHEQCLRDLLADEDLRRMGADEAEAIGLARHGVSGGGLAATNPSVVVSLVEGAAIRRERAVSDLSMRLSEHGMSLHVSGRGKVSVIDEPEYPFDDVKALDLHDMDYDFPGGSRVSATCARAFAGMCDCREAALSDAIGYLEASGQSEFIADLPVEDIRRMREVADGVLVRGAIEQAEASGHVRRRASISLDYDHVGQMTDAVLEQVAY